MLNNLREVLRYLDLLKYCIQDIHAFEVENSAHLSPRDITHTCLAALAFKAFRLANYALLYFVRCLVWFL